ncbi:Hypothetical Protein FCC1311_022632 [Hondaea fermentalgiana]|uniref:Uncharacterized protein n=1 Tax=Hondaea fermentalgiana TaxID=2315210 RepID=A0A2R5GBT8_9STRA|nr:Hypothetical Protein FCC1311_022632 [Hondaea fermentalgiana]|eukprot:GBG26043.1 Hypothetical Protein FCC1311_022632 [Hondaea fermentalgiana]
MQMSIKVAVTVLALALVKEGSAFTIENPTSTDAYTSYTAQEPISGTTVYVASGGPSGLESGNCTFSTGTEDEWNIKERGGDTTTVNGCTDVVKKSNSANSLPRKYSASGNAPSAFDSTDQWCFIGEVNDGGSSAANAGVANYNAKDGQNDKWTEWAYCAEETTDEVYQYTSLKGFSKNESKNVDGYPCAGTWNYNTNDGDPVAVTSNCLPFDEYPPYTDGLDFSDVPEEQQAYWCYLEPGDGSRGYNPEQVDSEGNPTDKVYSWGFCQDSEDPYTDSSSSDTAAPTASPTESPTEESSTEAPTSESGNSTETGNSTSTEAPTQAPETDSGTSAPTPDDEEGSSGEAPSAATGLSVSMLLATAAVARAL